MEYYFLIAGVQIKVEADAAFDWNSHIKIFETKPFQTADEMYRLRLVDMLKNPEGEIVYQGATCS